MSLTLQSTVKLSTGALMPVLGFGVYKSERSVCEQSIASAIKVGYRHIDCAQYYDNEDLVGKVATSGVHGVKREDLFLTTKTFQYKQGDTVDSLLPGLIESVEKMHPTQSADEQPYVDLFLIHTPSMGPEGRQTLWDAFQEVTRRSVPASELEKTLELITVHFYSLTVEEARLRQVDRRVQLVRAA